MSQDVNRRQLMQRIGLTALIAGPGISMLSACATGGGSSTPEKTIAGNGSATNPFSVKADAPIEVVIFNGGLGDGYATQGHEPMYVKEFPAAKVKHVATQKIATTLRPRFTSGDVPDVVANSGADILDIGELAAEGSLADLSALYTAPAIGAAGKTVKDTLIKGMDKEGDIDGTPRTLKYVLSIYGLWYDANLFKKNNWNPAVKTFDEFKALLDKIKAAGVTPYAYAGANASYYQMWMILITAAKSAGNQIIIDIDNLAAGAWTNDAVKKSAAAWAEIGAKYMDKGHLGLKHTEVQTLQNQGKIGFYPSGSWLENEQKTSTPPTFEYAVVATPALTASDKLPYEAIRAAAGEDYFVSAKAKNPKGGLEYLRIMLSKDGAQAFTKQSGSLTIVDGAADGLKLTPGTLSAQGLQKAAGQNIIPASKFEDWYLPLKTEVMKQVNQLMSGKINADQFCTNCQQAADKIKADSSVKKHTRS